MKTAFAQAEKEKDQLRAYKEKHQKPRQGMPEVPVADAAVDIDLQPVHHGQEHQIARQEHAGEDERAPTGQKFSLAPVKKQGEQQVDDAEKNDRQPVGEHVDISDRADQPGEDLHLQAAGAEEKGQRQRDQKGGDFVGRCFHGSRPRICFYIIYIIIEESPGGHS